MVHTQKVKLNNGLEIPILGLGTWQSKPGEVTQAVKDAIDAGYRHIDGALIYQNENEVGEGVNAKIAEGVVKREDLWITSKLWNTHHHPSLVRKACEKTLKDLNLKYLDLYLVHWPFAFKEGDDLFPRGADGKVIYSDVDYLDTWKEMEKLVDDGLVKSIGISNFNSQQTDRLVEAARIKPVTNQVECHPYLNQAKLIAHSKKHNIVLTAYSPLGSPARESAKPDDPSLFEDPVVVAIAKKYNKTSGQVLIKFQIARGVIVIPKSVTKSRIIQNGDVFDFELTAEDLAALEGINRNLRLLKFDPAAEHPLYGFNIEY